MQLKKRNKRLLNKAKRDIKYMQKMIAYFDSIPSKSSLVEYELLEKEYLMLGGK